MMKQVFECKVADIVERNFCVVLNKGKNAGIREGMRFLIYNKGNEIFDPDTNESLGTLEIVCGHGVVTNVQDKCATVKCTDQKVKTVKINTPPAQKSLTFALGWPWLQGLHQEEEKITELPFEHVERGSLARYLDGEDEGQR